MATSESIVLAAYGIMVAAPFVWLAIGLSRQRRLGARPVPPPRPVAAPTPRPTVDRRLSYAASRAAAGRGLG